MSQARVLPAQLSETDATSLVSVLKQHGVDASVVDAPPTSLRCKAHPSLTGDTSCATCGAATCPLCGDRCGDCAAKVERSERWKWRRVAVLLVVFAIVAFGAALKTRRLQRRSDWTRPVVVSVVLTSSQPTSAQVENAWRDGLEQLQGWFASEARRHGISVEAPVRFLLAPEVRQVTLASPPAWTGSAWQDVQLAWAYKREVARVASPQGDVHLVVVLGDGSLAGARVEGLGERGGEYGVVMATAKDTQLTLELMAVAHETLHCLGAADAYDEQGHALVPQGLVEPELGFPQAKAEVMVGEVPLGPSSGRLPVALEEVGVGPETAREVGWMR